MIYIFHRKESQFAIWVSSLLFICLDLQRGYALYAQRLDWMHCLQKASPVPLDFRPPGPEGYSPVFFLTWQPMKLETWKLSLLKTYLLLQMGGKGGPWPLISMISPSTHWPLFARSDEVRGCHRSNPLEANVWESQVISRFGSWESSTVGWDLAIIFIILIFGISVGYHFGIWWSFENLAFLMIFHINYSIAIFCVQQRFIWCTETLRFRKPLPVLTWINIGRKLRLLIQFVT